MLYESLPKNTTIEFSFQTKGWDESEFRKSGGFVAVVLNYNKKAEIKVACESALQQDFTIYEVLFMDDASTDGSYDIMLDVARAFSADCKNFSDGRQIKLTVVKNLTNQTILGQWSIAVSISKGTWFGMFCGDDISLPCRIQTVKSIIASYPTVRAVCTSGQIQGGGRIGKGSTPLAWRGTDRVLPLNYWLGCTSFWHRDVLIKSFGRHNMDDFVLMWNAIILCQGTSDVVLIWALDKSTIQYKVGTGVSTEHANKFRSSNNWLAKTWNMALAARRFGKKFCAHTWKFIVEFDKRYGKDSYLREQIHGYYRLNQMKSANWFGRLKILIIVLIFERRNEYGGVRKEIIEGCLKTFSLFLLGPISFVMLLAPKELVRRIRRKLPENINKTGE